MKDFLLIYRNDQSNRPMPSPEEMQAVTKKWMDWVGSIAARDRLIDRGNRLGSEGRVLKANDVITDGPYTEIKEVIGGYSLIKAENYDEAVEIAKGCPIFQFGGSVEVRDINPME